jgi:hypothetical protein
METLLKERVFDIEEFKAKVDRSKPIHYASYEKCIDSKHGMFYRVWFTMTGIAKEGHLIEYYVETTRSIGSDDIKRTNEWINKLIHEHAVPLGATPGEWLRVKER